MKYFLRIFISILIAIFNALLLYACFPPYQVSFLAWIALVPLFTFLNFARYVEAFSMSFLMGMTFCAFYAQWLNMVPDFPIIAFVSVCLYTGIYFGLFGLFFTFIIRRSRCPKIIVAPVLWVSIEYLRSNLSFLAIPVGLIGHSQYDNIPIIQIASVTSVYGISFIIVLINSAITEIFLRIFSTKLLISLKRPSSSIAIVSIATAIVTVLAVYLWGKHQINVYGKNTKGILTVSLIQGNIPQNEKWDDRFRKNILDHYGELTIKASQENPDLIIWPETATPGYLKNDLLVYLSVSDVIKKTGIPLLLGSASNSKIKREGMKSYRLANTAFLLNGNGKIVSAYNKMRLLPFGEYLPLEDKFPWPKWLVPDNGMFIPGIFHTVFEISNIKFGVVICWENLFPDLVRKFVIKGSHFMVNLSNEAWFGKTAVSNQIMAISVFRAVENRVALLRCANTGITGLIDPFGRIQGKVTDKKGNDIMVTGILTVTVPEPSNPTFYTRNGDVFAIGCTLIALIFIVSATLPLRMRKYLKITGDEA